MNDWIEANGVVHRYEHRKSSGPTVVLVHELGGALESWDEVVSALPAGVSTLRYDCRGAGLSEKPRAEIHLPMLTQDLHDLVRKLEVSGPLVVVGCALGGGIAMHFAGTYPDRCAGAVGLSAVVSTDPRNAANIRARADRIESGQLRAVAQEVLAASFPPELRGDGASYARCHARWLTNDPFSLAASYRMLVGLGDHAVLDRIECPVLLLAATRDTMFPPAVQRSMAKKLRRAEVVELETGHFPSVITPGPVALAIARFLHRL
jgi:3-oxoadipate enol-lactonase